jgi:hypothetical protein
VSKFKFERGDVYIIRRRGRRVRCGIIRRAGIDAATGIEATRRGIEEVPMLRHTGRIIEVYRRRVYLKYTEFNRSEAMRSRLVEDPLSAMGRAKLMLGLRYPWWRHLAYWIDEVILGDEYLVRSKLSTSTQSEGAWLVGLSYVLKITDRPSWAKSPDDIAEWCCHGPSRRIVTFGWTDD